MNFFELFTGLQEDQSLPSENQGERSTIGTDGSETYVYLHESETKKSDSIELLTSAMQEDIQPTSIPLSLQSIVTQSDSSGNQIIHQSNLGNTNASDQNNTAAAVNGSDERSLSSFICCLFRDRGNQSSIRSAGASNNSNLNTHQHPGIRGSFRSLISGHRPLPAEVPIVWPISPKHNGRKLLALDLDETLVHSSFQPVQTASFVIPVNIDGIQHNVFVIKRPGVDEFLKRVSEHYEVVIYTASLSKYADPLLNELDKEGIISKRFFRENCVFFNGHFVKDLALFKNRDLSQMIIIDNSPMSYIFQPENAIDCSSFIDNRSDVEMWQIADFLVAINKCEDVRKYCRRWREWCRQNPSSAPINPA